MRLTALSLTRYGNFAASRVTLDPRPGTLNLLVAPNGAGKSVLRGAFCDLLFGIGGQTPMDFRFGYAGMQIMVDAVAPDGTPFTFGRRKGKGNTLIDADGNALEPHHLARLLGTTDRTLLERLFALDTERLREGGADLRATNGALGEALVAGAGVVRHARQLREALAKDRDDRAPVRKSAQKPFHAELTRFTEARKRVSDTALHPDRWRRQQQDLSETEQRQKAENERANAASARIARLERIRRIAPSLIAMDEAAAWLARHPDAPALDPSLAERLADARTAVVLAGQRAERERAGMTELAERLAAVTVDDPALVAAEEITRLFQAVGKARAATADLPARMIERDAAHDRIRDLLRDLGRALPVERAGEAVPQRALKQQAGQLIARHTALLEPVQTLPDQIAALGRDQAMLDQRLGALPPAADTGVLEPLLREIRADGDPATRLAAAATALAEARAALAEALARVPGWTGGQAGLLALRPFQADIYERHAAEMAQAQAEATDRLRQLEAARQARDDARRRMAAITAAGPVPDEAGLVHARARRDDGWRLIYRRAFTADPPTVPEEQAFAGPLPLPIAYERAVSAADTLADRRVRDATLVAQADAARTALDDAETQLGDAERRHRVATEAAAATERTWIQICAALPLPPLPALRDVLGFLAARERVIEAARAEATATQAHDTLAIRQSEWAGRLAAALALPPSTPLPALLTEADRRVAAARRTEKDRASLETKCETTRRDIAAAALRLETAEAALAAWQSDWARLLRDLGRPADEDPAITQTVLLSMDDLDKERRRADSLTERIEGMTADNARFASEVRTLAATLDPALADGAPFDVVAALYRRLKDASDQRTQRDLLAERHEAARRGLEEAEQALAERQAALRAVLVLIGAATPEAAEARLALAAERHLHATVRDQAEAALHATGIPVGQLRAEIASVSADAIPALIAQSEQDRTDAQEAAQTAAGEASALRQQIAREAAELGATEAAAAQQAAAATMGRVLEEALVLHIAGELLQQSLGAVEQAGDATKIGALFNGLTDGTYARVLTEIDERGQPRLAMVENAFPDERKSVEQLSEGTRDQLFLALRLAAIQEHAARSPALPFIGDDILQTFDDDRALATMRVLRDISRDVQVILLTHHRHLVDLAARLPDGAVHVCGLTEMAA